MIQSVDRAARILRALSSGSGRLGVSELADRLGLAKTTVHGLLRTLHDHGLVEQDPDSDKYQLGPQLLQLSNRYLDLSELRTRSLAWSELLSTRSGESVRVGVPHGDGVLIVHHVFRPDTSLQILEVGAMLPMHATALGKAVLAYLPASHLVARQNRRLERNGSDGSVRPRLGASPGDLNIDAGHVRGRVREEEGDDGSDLTRGAIPAERYQLDHLRRYLIRIGRVVL